MTNTVAKARSIVDVATEAIDSSETSDVFSFFFNDEDKATVKTAFANIAKYLAKQGQYG